MSANIQLGATRATSYMNQTSNIFFTPQKYRAVELQDAGAVFGLVCMPIVRFVFFFFHSNSSL
jgi:hypothetical protein